MEFKFNLNDFFRENIVEIGPNLIPPGYSPPDKRALWDTVNKVSEVVNIMGQASAAAQGLTKSITTSDRLRNSEQKVYLLLDKTANGGRGAVTGMLKTGKKGLYVFDRDGHHYQVQPACVLDFYVHESKQRMGLGKQLFEHMLEREKVEPVKLAIDRPSDKFLGFLNKHYALDNPVKQMNNFVVFDGFFPEPVGAKTEVSDAPTHKSNQQAANGLQTAFTPYGRYGAPRPPCSMGQIIHNQSPLSHQAQEPNGTSLNIRPAVRKARSCPVSEYHTHRDKMNGTASEPEIKYTQHQQQQQNQGNAGQQHQQQQHIGQIDQQIAQNYARELHNIPQGQVQPVFNTYHQQLAQPPDPNQIVNKGAAVQPYQDAMQQHYLQQQQQYAQQMALLQQQQQQQMLQQQQQQQQPQMLQKQQQKIPREQLQAQVSQPQVHQMAQEPQPLPLTQQIAQVQQQAPQTQIQIPQTQPQIPHGQQAARVQQQAPQAQQQISHEQKQMSEAQKNALAQEKLAQAQQQVAQVEQQVAQFQQNLPQLANQMQAHVGQYQLFGQQQQQQPQAQQQYAETPQQYATEPQHVHPTMQQQYVQQQVQPQAMQQQQIQPQIQHVPTAPPQLQHMPCDGMQEEQIPATQQQSYSQQPQMAQQTYQMLKPEIQQYAMPQHQQYAPQLPAQQAYRTPDAANAYAQQYAAQQAQQPSRQVSEAQIAQQQGLPQHAQYQSVPNIATGTGPMPQPLHHAQSAIYQQPMYQQPAQQQYVQPPYEGQVVQSSQYAKPGYQPVNQQPMQTYYTPQGVASMQQQSAPASSMEALQAANIAQQATPVAGYSSMPSVPTQQVQRVPSGRVNAQNQQVYQQNQATAAQSVPNAYQSRTIAPPGNVQPHPRSPLPNVQAVPSGRVNPQNQQIYQQNQATPAQSVPNTYQAAHPRSPMTMASPATVQPQGVAVEQNMYAQAPQGMEPQVMQANAGNYQYFEHPEAAAKMDHHHHLPVAPLQNAGGKATDEENQAPHPIQEVHFEEQAPPPKLERPHSLPLQTSDEQEQIDGVIDEIIPEVKKVVIKESASPAKMATNDQPEKKKTPSHLTDQGYVDLKFYHNKLW